MDASRSEWDGEIEKKDRERRPYPDDAPLTTPKVRSPTHKRPPPSPNLLVRKVDTGSVEEMFRDVDDAARSGETEGEGGSEEAEEVEEAEEAEDSEEDASSAAVLADINRE